MKASNDLIKKFGVDKVIHGLVGIVVLTLCVLLFMSLLGASLISIASGIVVGLLTTYFLAKWKESRDDIPDKKDIKATMRGAYLSTIIVLLIWIIVWIIKLPF